jgi:predicted amidophosphoribosyltransferase
MADEQAIRASIIAEWDGADFYVLPYYSKRSGRNNEVTEFILTFKNNWSAEVALASSLVVDTLAASEEKLKDIFRCQYVLAAPSSRRGFAGNAAESVCAAIARRFGLTHLRGALERTVTVPKSAYAAPGERPDYERHLETIKYVGPDLNLRGKGVILFDDVYTRGETSSACRTILKNATRCSYVIGVFLGRTQ